VTGGCFPVDYVDGCDLRKLRPGAKEGAEEGAFWWGIGRDRE